MINFRASSSGNCIREIVTTALQPEPEKFEPFLMDGHGLQHSTTEFLTKSGIEIPTFGQPELEGVFTYKGKWQLTGHVDGVVIHDPTTISILEIKAIMSKSFDKLRDTNDWRGIYGNYVPQIQAYMGYDALSNGRSIFRGPMGQTFMVFKNRDTGEIMSPFQLHDGNPKHIHRQDLLEYRDPKLFKAIIKKFDKAANHIRLGEIPDECDYGGYCFFCERMSGAGVGVWGGRTVVLPGEDEKALADMVQEYRALKRKEKRRIALAEKIVSRMDSMQAETIRLEFKGKNGINIKRWEFAEVTNR